MKKILSVLSIAALSMSLVACGDSSDSKKEAEGKEKITIKYANWNVNVQEEVSLERLMIEEYEKQNKNIDIVIDETIDPTDYVGSLAAAASAGQLPDVFMIENIPTALANDWLMDIAEYTKKDNEWESISAPVRENVQFGEKIYAVPFAQHMLGYYINKDLFNSENIDIPSYGWSIDEFTSSVKSLTNAKKNIIGLGNVDSVVDWYPAVANDKLGYYTWDGEKYHLNSKEFTAGVNLARELSRNSYVFENLDADAKAKFDGEFPSDAFKAGQIGIQWDGSWAITDLTDLASIEWDYIGVPGGKNIIANDYLGVSATTKEAQASYDFAKWMSHSKEGFFKRLELAEANDKALNTLPLSTDEEVLEKYFATVNVPGLEVAYENIDKAIVEPVKTVPGYLDARWNASTGVKIADKDNATIGDLIFNSLHGDVKIEDYANQLNELANKKNKEAKEFLGQ